MLDRQVKDIYIEYDKRGNETKRYWLNSKGEEVDSSSNPNGNTRREREYDIYGRMCKESWFGRGEKEARTIKEYKHDPFGRVIATYTITSSNGKQNILVERKEYDKYGNCCKTYDAEGKPFIDDEAGAFKVVFAYDNYGNISDVRCFDAEDAPCQAVDDGIDTGVHHVKVSYNIMGKLLSVEAFNTEEKPTLYNGVHKAVGIYDTYGLLIERAGYNEKQQLIKRRLYKYDSEGNEIEEERVE